MVVLLGKRTYLMSQRAYQKFLDEVASPEVPFGVYAVEKDGQSEIRLDHCKSMTQLKKLTRQFTARGFKVYANGR